MRKRSLFRRCASAGLISFSVLAGIGGCGSDDGTGSIGVGSDEMAARSNASVRVPCSADSDCKAIASTCDACSCLVVGSDGALPKCNGSSVVCVVDPCRGKTAICSAGQCAVFDGASL
jgi:hypothetical protein